MPSRHYTGVPNWPDFSFREAGEDGLVPVCVVNNWRQFQKVLLEKKFDSEDELIFRGQRRFDWGLVPSLGRYSKKSTADATSSGAISEELAQKHIERFRLSLRGRGVDPSILNAREKAELWALGQHYGLMTTLLDWTFSPYIALFFAFEQKNSKREKPKNYTRSIFVMNKTKVEQLPGLEHIFIQPLSNDHSRLVSQHALFTNSPTGNETLETMLTDGLTDNGIDIDSPQEVSQFIMKINIKVLKESDRLECLRMLHSMNIHYASLFPDSIGSAKYCNQLLMTANGESVLR